MGVSIGDCSPAQVPLVRDFMARMYRPDYPLAADESFFRWQFSGSRNGAGNDTDLHLKLALVDQRLVGCLGYVPVEVSVGEEILPGAWTANWMIDPSERRLGLGPLLMRELTRQFAITLVVGLSGDAHTLLPRMGWTSFGNLDRYVCVLDPSGAAKLTETRELEWPRGAVERATEFTRPAAVSRVTEFASKTTGLWDRLCAEGRYAGTRRSAKFLNWRYAAHPVHRYRIFEATDDGALLGFAVYRVESVRDLAVKVGRIVELVAVSHPERLLRAVLDDARLEGVVALDFFCSGRRFSATMEGMGFLGSDDRAAEQVPILFQPIDRRRKVIPFMAHLGNRTFSIGRDGWYVTKGDGDQDRPN